MADQENQENENPLENPIDRRTLLKYGLGFLGATALLGLPELGCAPTAPPTPTPAPAKPPPAAPAPAVAPKVAPKVTEIKIGSLVSLTGGTAYEGNIVDRAIKLRIKECNEAGGIKSLGGAKINLLVGDTQTRPDVGAAEAERLIREGCPLIMGAFNSAVTIVTTQVAERERTPHYVSVAASDKITRRGFRYTFRHQPDSAQYGEFTVKLMKELVDSMAPGLKRVAFIHEDTEMGLSMYAAALPTIKALGFDVVEDVIYNSARATDVTSEATRVRASKPELILINGYYGDTVLWMRTLRDLKVDVAAILGIANSCMSNPRFSKEDPKLAEYMMDGNYWWDPKRDRTKKVAEAYEKAYNEPFTNHAAVSYQSADCVIQALEAAASIDKEAIREALAKQKLTDIIMPGEVIEYDATGQNPKAQPLLLQFQKGVPIPVGPAKYALAKPIFPIPKLEERMK